MAAMLADVPEDFIVLSGDDGITLPLMALGGRGLISVASNEIPAEMTQIVKLALANDFAAARKIHQRYFRLMETNFVETNPGPVKAALALMGLLDPVFRLPLVPPKPENLAKIRSALEAVGLVQRGLCCKLRSSGSSTKIPPQYSAEHLRAVSAIQSRAECGRNSRG